MIILIDVVRINLGFFRCLYGRMVGTWKLCDTDVLVVGITASVLLVTLVVLCVVVNCYGLVEELLDDPPIPVTDASLVL